MSKIPIVQCALPVKARRFDARGLVFVIKSNPLCAMESRKK